MLDRTGAGTDAVILTTSDYQAALAGHRTRPDDRLRRRLVLVGAVLLGSLNQWIKGSEFPARLGSGRAWVTRPFFNLYYMPTGFYAAHAIAGLLILLVVAWRDQEGSTVLWYIVALVSVVLFLLLCLL